MTETPRIDRLPELVAALPESERALAERLFQIVETEGEIVPPPEMEPWLERTFGSVEATLHQHIIRVTNRWTFEGATFNPAARAAARQRRHPAAAPGGRAIRLSCASASSAARGRRLLRPRASHACR